MTRRRRRPPAQRHAPPAQSEAPSAQPQAPSAQPQAPPSETQGHSTQTQVHSPHAQAQAPPLHAQAPPPHIQTLPRTNVTQSPTQAHPPQTQAPPLRTQEAPAPFQTQAVAPLVTHAPFPFGNWPPSPGLTQTPPSHTQAPRPQTRTPAPLVTRAPPLRQNWAPAPPCQTQARDESLYKLRRDADSEFTILVGSIGISKPSTNRKFFAKTCYEIDESSKIPYFPGYSSLASDIYRVGSEVSIRYFSSASDVVIYHNNMVSSKSEHVARVLLVDELADKPSVVIDRLDRDILSIVYEKYSSWSRSVNWWLHVQDIIPVFRSLCIGLMDIFENGFCHGDLLSRGSVSVKNQNVKLNNVVKHEDLLRFAIERDVVGFRKLVLFAFGRPLFSDYVQICNDYNFDEFVESLRSNGLPEYIIQYLKHIHSDRFLFKLRDIRWIYDSCVFWSAGERYHFVSKINLLRKKLRSFTPVARRLDTYFYKSKVNLFAYFDSSHPTPPRTILKGVFNKYCAERTRDEFGFYDYCRFFRNAIEHYEDGARLGDMIYRDEVTKIVDLCLFEEIGSATYLVQNGFRKVCRGSKKFEFVVKKLFSSFPISRLGN